MSDTGESRNILSDEVTAEADPFTTFLNVLGVSEQDSPVGEVIRLDDGYTVPEGASTETEVGRGKKVALSAFATLATVALGAQAYAVASGGEQPTANGANEYAPAAIIPKATPPAAASPSPKSPPSPNPSNPLECPTGSEAGAWNPTVLDGHVLPAFRGGAGLEEAIDEQGRVGSTGHPVSYAQYARLGKAYRDNYITMRWDSVEWSWLGGSTRPTPEDLAWYKSRNEPLKIVVINPATGASIVAAVLESGPAPWAGTPGGQSDQSQKALWNKGSGGDGYVNGTPEGYNGRVAGLPPTAAKALGMKQWVHGGSRNGGEGSNLIYAFAPDQTVVPGKPGGLNAAASALLLQHADRGPTELTNLMMMCNAVFNTNVSLAQVNTGSAPDIPVKNAEKCTTGEQKGTRKLYDFIKDMWNTSDNPIYGTFNCRDIAGTDSLSLHAEGRALDAGLDAHDPAQKIRGDQVFAWAIKNAHLLGVQEVIWNRHIWTPEHGLQEYNGENPHTDHVHLGLTWNAAKAETPIYKWGVLDARKFAMAGEKQ